MYVLLLTGQGDGCDYTIGCNITWEFIKTDDPKKAMKAAVERIEEFGTGDSYGPGIEEATLIKIEEKHEIDIKALHNKMRSDAEKKKAEKELKDKKAMFEKLKKELGE